MKHIIYLTLLTLLVLFSCCKKKYEKRYPEDTESTYDSPEERLCDKWWVLDSVSVNGVNFTDSVHNMVGIYRFSISLNKIKSGIFEFRESLINIENPNVNFNVGFSTDKEFSSLYFVDLDGFFHGKDTVFSFIPFFYKPQSANWDIRKLEQHNLKIQTSGNDTVLINYFKSI